MRRQTYGEMESTTASFGKRTIPPAPSESSSHEVASLRSVGSPGVSGKSVSPTTHGLAQTGAEVQKDKKPPQATPGPDSGAAHMGGESLGYAKAPKEVDPTTMSKVKGKKTNAGPKSFPNIKALREFAKGKLND